MIILMIIILLYLSFINALLDEHILNFACYIIGDFNTDIEGKFFNKLTHAYFLRLYSSGF